MRQGAREIDMVINIGALKSRDYETVFEDICRVVKSAQPAGVKVILETSSLNDDQKIIGCALSKAAGAAFVKTSTGFGPGGATAEDIALMRAVVGDEVAYTLESMTRAIYTLGEELAREQGIIIADTKFEFGRDKDGRIILIDEVMTPDSSRFWAVDAYKPGQPQASFDKQFLRDFLAESGWNKQPPPPALPPDVIAGTASRYEEALRRLTS
jgi:phosphoribosylaminoimidazole-succinocarboxamide synthase